VIYSVNRMKIMDLPIAGLKLIELKLHGDERGFFVERFRANVAEKHGIPTFFPQDNHSRSGSRVLRGLHYQPLPPQGKLVGVIRGSIFDVAVDIRADSPTFGQHYSVELSDMNGRLLWIPAGFAHGFCVTSSDPADVFYKMDDYYEPTQQCGIRWDDPELKIKWPIQDPLISPKDEAAQSFAQYRASATKLR
jgi:dTDP-4-dehydrorhamnose 3,5-epimerase